jgi:hypothetical protein
MCPDGAFWAALWGGEAYPVEQFTIGPFGLMTSSRSANFATRIIKFQGCGPAA